jgi:hypothetical protein
MFLRVWPDNTGLRLYSSFKNGAQGPERKPFKLRTTVGTYQQSFYMVLVSSEWTMVPVNIP